MLKAETVPQIGDAFARAGDVGGEVSPDHLVAALARIPARRERTPVRHPGAVRPWRHVLEPVAVYARPTERPVEACLGKAP